MQKNQKFSILLISALIFSFTNIPITQAASVFSTKYNCELKVDTAHLSTTSAKKGRGDAVKVKAKVSCDKYQDNTQILIRIIKEGFIFTHNSETFPLTTEKRNGYVVAHKTAEIPCVNGRLSKYYGEAKAVIKIKNELINLGPVFSDYISLICCGT